MSLAESVVTDIVRDLAEHPDKPTVIVTDSGRSIGVIGTRRTIGLDLRETGWTGHVLVTVDDAARADGWQVGVYSLAAEVWRILAR